jgi:hypothetical protein
MTLTLLWISSMIMLEREDLDNLIIQNQFKISEVGKWNSHQMPCAYSSRMVKNYRICPIKAEIIHGRHRVVQIYTWAGGYGI